ncbi:MAG: hypothetical protein KVP17_002197 [Porospora cf. gigantea B]|uniref:uncharacterized protein n=1 Tax=Porospora cf. gigantea B TaxID=2853592 RepID=UPI003571ACCE|nr:MAG: hypothetical protein KVP17_002197 [Porospora cf. gigantea B]
MSARLLVGPVLGAVTARSARILLETDRDCHVEVQLLSTGHQSRHRARLRACVPKAVIVDGLGPETEYTAYCIQLGWRCRFTTTGPEGPCSLVPVSCASLLSDRAVREIQEMHVRVPTSLLHLDAPINLHESVDIDRMFARRAPQSAAAHSARLAAVLTANPGISTLAQLCSAFCQVHQTSSCLIADLRRIMQGAVRFALSRSASSKLYSRLPSEFLAGYQPGTEPMPVGLMWRRVLNMYLGQLCADGVLIRGSLAVARSSTDAFCAALTPTVTTLLTMSTEVPQQWRLSQRGRLCLCLSTGTSDSSIDVRSGRQWSHVLVASARLLWTTFYHQSNSVQQHKRERFESNLKPELRFTNLAEKSDPACGSFTQLVKSFPFGFAARGDRYIRCQETVDEKTIVNALPTDDKESTYCFQRRVRSQSSSAGMDSGILGESAIEDIAHEADQVAWSHTNHQASEPQLRVPLTPVSLGSNSSPRFPSLLGGESAIEDIVREADQVAWSHTNHQAAEPQMRVPLTPVSLGSNSSPRFPSLLGGESAIEDIVREADQVAWSHTNHQASEPQMRVPLTPVSLASNDTPRFPSWSSLGSSSESTADDALFRKAFLTRRRPLTARSPLRSNPLALSRNVVIQI